VTGFLRALLVGAVVAATGCGGDSIERSSARPFVFALLSDRGLLKVSATDGRVLRSIRLGTRAPPAGAVSDFIAPSRDPKRLFVLVPAAGRDRQSIVELDSATLKIQQRFPLPAGMVFRSLQTGPRSGRLYVLGNRGTDRNVNAPILLVLDQNSGAIADPIIIRPAHGRDWYVTDAAISSDERYLAVSYHGPDTTGADWISLSEAPKVCSDRTPAYLACIRLHGDIAFREHHLVATTGEGPLVERNLDGRLARSWRPKVPRNHLTHFTFDTPSGRAVVLGSCGYTGGLSVISLDSVSAKVIGYPKKVCGEAASFVQAGLLAVARNALPVPQGAVSQIDFVDLDAGRILRHTPTRSDVVALVASR
jgi:hypothetical protein